MKSRTLRILICFVLGVLTTVGVAWMTFYPPIGDGTVLTHHLVITEDGDVVGRSSTVQPADAGWPFLAVHGIGGTRPSPIWPGFLINTLFYGAPWFGLFFGVGSTRRFIRTRRGRCPRCGYDLRGRNPHPQPLSHLRQERGVTSGGGCPECGWNRPPTKESA